MNLLVINLFYGNISAQGKNKQLTAKEVVYIRILWNHRQSSKENKDVFLQRTSILNTASGYTNKYERF